MLHLAFRALLLAGFCLAVTACGDDDFIGDDDRDGGADEAMAGRGGMAGSSGRFDIDAGFRDGGGEDPDAAGDEDAGGEPCTNEADCDDDDACTEDTCRRGVCVNAAIDPDDGDACTTDSCDPDTGVQHEGVAVADADPCTTDSCDPDTGVAHDFCASGLCDSTEVCLDLVTTAFDDATPVTIPTGPGAVTDTIVVSGVGTYLWDLNVRTSIAHVYPTELDVTLQSPAGTIVTLTTDNGADSGGTPVANAFNGTVWDDSANPAGAVPYSANPGLVTNHPYVSGVATPLVPEEPLGAFLGEDPNGTWTLTIVDDTTDDGGALSSWRLEVVTLSAAPTVTIETLTQSTPVPITDHTVVTSTIDVPSNPAATRLCSLTVNTNIAHTYSSDLSVALTSPDGRIVTLTANNADTYANVFAGTLWNDEANPAGQVPYNGDFASEINNGLVREHAYADLTLASPLAPEEALSSFIGETVAGTWTLAISDDGTNDMGALQSWSLNIGRCMR